MISSSVEKNEALCPHCDAVVPEDAPGGICPTCILGLGISHHGEETIEVSGSPPGTAFTAPTAADLDELFEQLEVIELVGQGGMGAVYRAKQVSLDREVAIKILPPFAGEDPSFIERFQREARALARLTHPNIVMVFEFGQVANMFYFVMEYVDGVNLREAIIAGGLTNREALKVIPQICEALQFAHDHGIVHRDIKPENIMLDAKGRVKITDFGLAKLLERNAVNFTLTSTNQLLGTVKYMAPEQIENPNAVDHRSDIYSLGVVFYELLTGELPLGRFDPPSCSAPANEPLDPVVMRTLEKSPLNRFQNASEVKTAIEDVVLEETGSPSSNLIPPQKSIPLQKTVSRANSRPRMPVVNFQLAKVFYGFGSGKGVMRVDFENEELILDIQIKDFLGGMFHSDYKEVRIAFDHVLSFKPAFGKWFGHNQLEIQTDYFKELGKLPGAENGGLTLVFEQKNRKTAMDLCEQIAEALGMSDNHQQEEEEEVQVDEQTVRAVESRFEQPAALMKLAGIVDIIVAFAFLLGSFRFLELSRDGEVIGMATLGSVGLFCIGVFEIYLAYCAFTLTHWRPLHLGAIILCFLFPHPGILFMVPATIWMLYVGASKKTHRVFGSLESIRESNPSKRNGLWADKQTQFELWSRFRGSIFLLGFLGIVSLLVWISAAVQSAQNGNVGDEFGLVLIFTGFGISSLIGAILLFVNPSEFWVRAVAKTAMIPAHILFPITYFIGRRMLKKLDPTLPIDSSSGNPYVSKQEEFAS